MITQFRALPSSPDVFTGSRCTEGSKCALRGGLLVLCNLSPRLLELLKITKLDKLITIKATQQEAMRHFERMSALT